MPEPVPPSELPKASTILSLSTTSSRKLPFPVPVLTVTVYVAPEPITVATEAPFRVPIVIVKSVAFTPVTASEKVTVKSTLAALLGLELARTMEETEG